MFATDSSYQFLRSALYLFEILDKNTPALAALNSIGSIEPLSIGPNESDWVEQSLASIHDDTVYYIGDADVWTAFWHTPSIVNGPF